MFIAIIGTRSSGKSTVESYLVNIKGFRSVRLCRDHEDAEQALPRSRPSDTVSPIAEESNDFLNTDTTPSTSDHRLSFLTMSSPPTSCLPSPALDFTSHQAEPHCFTSSSDLLQHVTRNWRLNFVTVDLNTMSLLEGFVTRPFFLVVSVDAPLLVRYKRTTCRSDITVPSLEEFIREHDIHFYGMDRPTPPVKDLGSASSTLLNLNHFVNLHIVNSFDTVASLHTYLDDLDLLNAERLRPGWDVYFMQLASLASQRSNCMKRRVGAILVRNKRILATGYNGTPRGLKNCNEGGCVRCNSANETSDECVCLHAEENALLEAGRERIGDGAVLYCNTCPCLKCTIKIIQTGVREVVYNLGYKVDDDSAALFQEAGVVLRRHATPS